MRNKYGHLAAIFCVLVWGITFISTKILLKEFSPYEILLIRFSIGYICLWIMYPHMLKLKSIKHELAYMLAGVAGVMLYGIFENTALTMTMASNVSILVSTAPFFTALLAHFLLRDERLRLNFILGFGISILGIALVTFNGRAVLKLNPIGDILSVLCAIIWGIYSIIIRKTSIHEYPNLAVTRRLFFYGIVFMLIMQPFLKMNIDFSRIFAAKNFVNYIFLGVFACAICYCLWNFALNKLGAIVSGNYIYIIPIITMVASAIVLKENITFMAIIGTVFIISGLFISSR